MSNILEGQIGEHRLIDHEAKTGVLSSNEAKRWLDQEIGLTFKTADYKEIAAIASRDGEYTKYLAARATPIIAPTNQIFNLKGVAVGFIKDVLGQKDNESAISAEIVQIEVSPALRGRGLGTVVDCQTRMRHIEEGAKILRSYEADESGTIRRLNESLGYQKTGNKLFDGAIEWQLDVNDKNKDEILRKLANKFITTLARIKEGDLDFDPNIVDWDNPARKPIIEAIRQKSEADLQQPFIYGYQGSPVLISNEAGVLVVRVKNPDRKVFKPFEDRGYEVFPYPTTRLIDGYEIVGKPISEASEFRDNLEKLAIQVQALYDHQSNMLVKTGV